MKGVTKLLQNLIEQRQRKVCTNGSSRLGAQRRFFSITTDPSTPQPPSLSTLSSLAKLRNCYACLSRAIIKLEGDTAKKFLQGLTTNNIELLPESKIQYNAFLNAQGRVVGEGFITQSGSKSYLIDTDFAVGSALMKHLQHFNLRSKVNISDVTQQYKLWFAFGPAAEEYFQEESQRGNQTIFADPRIPQFGIRMLLPSNSQRIFIIHAIQLTQVITAMLPTSFRQVDQGVYELYRIVRGVTEGGIDCPSAHALPFECNLDYLNAVNFQKGCYLGQELTARTHYTGVIRKRLLPLIVREGDFKVTEWDPQSHLFPPFLFNHKFTIPFPSKEKTVFTVSGKKSGSTCSSVLNVGIAMLRLEHLEANPYDTVVKVEEDGKQLELGVLKPHWWSAYLQEKLEQEQKIANTFLADKEQQQ